MRDLQRVRAATLAVLAALLDGEKCGSDITARTGLRHPTVYASLIRLEEHGWATSRWEEPPPGRREWRSLRRFYTLLPEGRARAADLLAHRASTLDTEIQGRAA